jgi:type I restriction enzyme R subunit
MQLDSSVVEPDQIRSLIHTFRDGLPEYFAARGEASKTLIFAKTHSHADLKRTMDP